MAGLQIGRLLELLRAVAQGKGLGGLGEEVLREAVFRSRARGGWLLLRGQAGFRAVAALGCDPPEGEPLEVDPARLFPRPGEGALIPLEHAGEPVAYLGLLGARGEASLPLEEWAQVLGLAHELNELSGTASLFRFLFERLADAVYITAFDGTILEANPAAERQTGYPRSELIGMNIMRDIAAEEPAVTYELVNQRLARGETVVFEEKKRRRDGTTYWTECAVALFSYRGRPATISVNRDITDRKKLEEELRHRVEELSILSQLGRTVSASLDLRRVLEEVVVAAREVTRADYANCTLFDEEGRPQESFDPWGQMPLPQRMRSRGFSRWILACGQPLLVDEVHPDGSTTPRVLDQEGNPIPANPVLVEAGIRSLVGVPIPVEGRVRGILFAHSKRPRAFVGKLGALELLAGHAGVALANARLYRTAQEELRARQAAEKELRTLFYESPVALELQDLSRVKRYLDGLRSQGVRDLATYLSHHPGTVAECARLVRVLQANEAALHMFGAKDLHEFQALFPEIVMAEENSTYVNDLLAIWEGRTEYEVVGANRDREGNLVRIFLRWRVLPGYEGDYGRVLVSVLDITDRARMEEALRASEARYRALFEHSPISLWIEDFSQIKGRLDSLRRQGVGDLQGYLAAHPEFLQETLRLLGVVQVNRATLELYGVGSKEELLAHLAELIPEEVFPLWRKELLAIWEGRHQFQGVGINRTASGRTIHMLLSWRVLPGHEGDYGRVLVSVLDITDRVEAEEALRAVNSAIRALSSTLDLSALLRLIHDEAKKLLNFDSFLVGLVDRGRGELQVALAVEAGEELEVPPIPLSPEQGPTAWVAVRGKPLFFSDLEREPPPVPFRQVGRKVRSWAGVPLVAQGEVIGVLSVQGFSPRRFGERERQVLLALAAGAASALRNAVLHSQARAVADKLRTVEELSRRMKLATSKAELYGLVLDAVEGFFDVPYCAIFEAQAAGLVLVAHRGYPRELEGLQLAFEEGRGITVAAFLSEQPIYVPDVRADPRYVAGLPTMGCELAIPISVAGRRFGVLNLEHERVDGIPPQDRDIMKIVASELAVALLSLERLEELRSLSERLAGLHRAVQRLQRCTTEEEVLQTAVRVAQDILDFQICAIALAEGDVLVPKAAVGIPLSRTRCFRKGEGISGRTWQEGRALWGNIQDFPEAKPVEPSLFQSFISVPIGDFGNLQVAASRPDAFSRSDVELAEILAGHLREELQRVRLEAELREQAIRDSLTGLYNRRYLSEVLRREVQRARRYGRRLAVLIMDLDGFKLVNDRYGHLRGDQVLEGVARLIRGAVRESDLVFRYGGDEFVVILPETDTSARAVAARLRRRIARWAQEEGLDEVGLGISVGTAVWRPEAPLEPEELLRRADASLYRSKQRKRSKGGSTGQPEG